MNVKTKFTINAFTTSLVFSILLFIVAGRLDYWEGWIYLIANIITTLMNVLTISADSELMSERMKPGQGIELWDKKLLGISFLLFILTIVAAGLDSGRYHTALQPNWSLAAAGVLVLVSGQSIFLTARHENKFFSTVVRIQKERGHTVCDSGIYRIVRHPGYFGMMISTAGLPLILGSIWSVIPVLVSIIILCVRTVLEDNTLTKELDGYAEYAKKVRFKVLPKVW